MSTYSNFSVKSHRVAKWIEKQNLKTQLRFKDTYLRKQKGRKYSNQMGSWSKQVIVF